MTFNKGDLVRVGKGKVEWTVIEVRVSGLVDLLNILTDVQRTESSDKLTLIEAFDPAPTGGTTVPYVRRTSPGANDHRTSSYGKAILGALQSKPIYEGTVPNTVVDNRRKAGKVAKQSRKANR